MGVVRTTTVSDGSIITVKLKAQESDRYCRQAVEGGSFQVHGGVAVGVSSSYPSPPAFFVGERGS